MGSPVSCSRAAPNGVLIIGGADQRGTSRRPETFPIPGLAPGANTPRAGQLLGTIVCGQRGEASLSLALLGLLLLQVCPVSNELDHCIKWRFIIKKRQSWLHFLTYMLLIVN